MCQEESEIPSNGIFFISTLNFRVIIRRLQSVETHLLSDR